MLERYVEKRKDAMHFKFISYSNNSRYSNCNKEITTKIVLIFLLHKFLMCATDTDNFQINDNSTALINLEQVKNMSQIKQCNKDLQDFNKNFIKHIVNYLPVLKYLKELASSSYTNSFKENENLDSPILSCFLNANESDFEIFKNLLLIQINIFINYLQDLTETILDATINHKSISNEEFMLKLTTIYEQCNKFNVSIDAEKFFALEIIMSVFFDFKKINFMALLNNLFMSKKLYCHHLCTIPMIRCILVILQDNGAYFGKKSINLTDRMVLCRYMNLLIIHTLLPQYDLKDAKKKNFFIFISKILEESILENMSLQNILINIFFTQKLLQENPLDEITKFSEMVKLFKKLLNNGSNPSKYEEDEYYITGLTMISDWIEFICSYLRQDVLILKEKTLCFRALIINELSISKHYEMSSPVGDCTNKDISMLDLYKLDTRYLYSRKIPSILSMNLLKKIEKIQLNKEQYVINIKKLLEKFNLGAFFNKKKKNLRELKNFLDYKNGVNIFTFRKFNMINEIIKINSYKVNRKSCVRSNPYKSKLSRNFNIKRTKKNNNAEIPTSIIKK
ncbi:hypothetical protein EDEG_02963 [Edhazardia aedis USNM 41457]|uniref:Uncharacterized protein n=1 Tax=Edhazardia aedis (strain USNM 41457) TaxID=1003232 RepID=J8ZSL7_EDHAE|nr:hypothetical protein EDEG_02963 [Edhazardia aedis USNM 41457]|eukprot:EJW02643.1 hypothetical protein EDEG_02963 [Edhazardia aedis USNM 41457]